MRKSMIWVLCMVLILSAGLPGSYAKSNLETNGGLSQSNTLEGVELAEESNNGKAKGHEKTDNHGVRMSDLNAAENAKRPLSPWTLVWQDEFGGNSLDLSKWAYETGNHIVDENGNSVAAGWGNNEKQYYTENEENIKVENGELIISAKEEQRSDEFGSYEYTSGKIVTNGLFSKKYGKIKARMKLPEGQGLWPAFWMMPEDSVYGEWAASGEIDIMEAAGSDIKSVGGTIHYGGVWPNNEYSGNEYHFKNGKDYTGYHVYEIEWEPGEIRWFVDGELYSVKNDWYSKGANEILEYSYPAPFDQEFYMILNLAVGGWYDGDPEDSSIFPASMYVDYVRVYELSGKDYRRPIEPEYTPESLPEGAKLPLEDGNLIYNNNYDGQDIIENNPLDEGVYIGSIEGIANTDYWYDFNGAGGESSVTIDEIDGENFAKANIVAGGSETWAVQLMQDISLAKGNYYKLTFDGFAENNRPMTLKIGGDENHKYEAYATDSFDLETTKKTFSKVFQMTKDTDLDTRLEFHLGQNNADVYLGNIRVENIDPPEIDYDASKYPKPDGNLVYNGAFDKGDMTRFNYWNLETADAEAVPIVNESSRELYVDIAHVGASPESIILNQKGIQLEASGEYTLNFDAKAESSRSIYLSMVNADNSLSYLDKKEIALDDSMSSYEVKFTMNQSTDLNSELQFLFGSSEADVTIDNVSLFGKTDYMSGTPDISDILRDGFESLEGITGYTDAIGNASIKRHKMALNGDASLALKNAAGGWGGFYASLSESIDVSAYDHIVVSMQVPEGIDYLELKPESSEAGVFTNLLEYSSEIQGDWQTFKVPLKDFAPVDFSDLTTIGIWNPKANDDFVEAEILIDDLYFEVFSNDEEPGVTYGLETMTFDDTSETLTPWLGDQWSGVGAGEMVIENGELTFDITAVGGVSYAPKLEKFDLALEAGKTYELSFDARADIPRDILVNLGQGLDSAPWFIPYMDAETLSLTTEMATYTIEFTVSEATSTDLKIAFELGLVGEDVTLTKTYFDNISVTQK